MATAIVTLAELFALSTRTNVSARNTTYAAILAEQKMEELRSAGLKDAALGAQALKEARDGAGTRYDPKVVEAFAAVLESQGGTW